MGKLEDLFQILKEEYGIETKEQLIAEVKKLGGIDISPMCCPVPTRKKESA